MESSFPLSIGQQGLYTLCTKACSQGELNVALCVRAPIVIEPERLRTVWDRLVQEFPLLASTVRECEGELRHSIDFACAPPLEHHEVGSVEFDDLLERVREDVRGPVDLERGPLARLHLYQMSNEQSLLVIVAHRIVADEQSLEILLNRLLVEYPGYGERGRSPAPARSFAEFVSWERRTLDSERASHARYWEQQLDNEQRRLPLLPSQGGSGRAEWRILTLTVAEATCENIRAMQRRASVRPSMLFLGAWMLLIHRYTRQDDITVMVPAGLRELGDFAGAIGSFAHPLPIRVRQLESLRFSELLRNCHTTVLDALYHHAVPPSLFARGLDSTSTSFVFRDAERATWSVGEDIPAERIEAVTTRFQDTIELEVTRRNEGFSVRLGFDAARYSDGAARRLLHHYSAFLRAVSSDPSRFLHEYPLGARTYVAPCNATEMRLSELWAQVLGLEVQAIGTHDSFLELGGDSTLAVELVSRIRHEFAVDLPLMAIFERGNITQLAQTLAGFHGSGDAEVSVETGEI